MSAGLPTLPDAVEWLAGVWSPRTWPTRLHLREHEGWGLYYSAGFASHLAARPDDVFYPEDGCLHPNLYPGADHHLCPDCSGCGRTTASYQEYRYPMWRALTRLRRRHNLSYIVVMTLVINGYRTGDLVTLGIGEGIQLRAVRRLYAFYQRAPVPVPWTAKSDSQQRAEMVASP